MKMAFDRTKAASLTESVVQTLLGKILSGDLRAGDWLPTERELAEQLGVSRSSVHLAVLELAGKGFLETVPRRGTVVCDYRKHPTPDSLPLLMSYGAVELEQALFSDMMETAGRRGGHSIRLPLPAGAGLWKQHLQHDLPRL